MLSVEEINKQYGTQYNSDDDNIYVLSCNPSEDSFFIGCSMKKYISEFSKYFSKDKLCCPDPKGPKTFPPIYPEEAKNLAVSTMIGAGKMVFNNPDKTLDDLITAVCSKGGTTIEAINVYNNSGLSDITEKAVGACVKRSKELENL